MVLSSYQLEKLGFDLISEILEKSPFFMWFRMILAGYAGRFGLILRFLGSVKVLPFIISCILVRIRSFSGIKFV